MNHSESSVVVTTRSDSTYFLDVLTGEIQHAIKGGGEFAISADDAYLFHYSLDDSTFVKVSIATGEKIHIMQQDFKGLAYLDECAVSRDGRYGAGIYTSRQDYHMFGWRVWDLTTGQIIMDRSYVTDPKILKTIGLTRPVFVCGEGKLMLEVFKDYYREKDAVRSTRNYTVYDITSGDSLETFHDNLQLVAMNNDCSIFAEANYSPVTDGIFLYSRASKEIVSKMQIPGVAVFNTILFSQDNKYLIANSTDSLLFICQAADGKKVYSPGRGGCMRICVNHDLTLIPLVSGDQIYLLLPPKTLSLRDTAASPEQILYPNPTNQLVHVRMPKVCDGSLRLEVYDAVGKELRVGYECQGSDLVQLDVSNLPAGVYRVVVMRAQSYLSYTLVVN